MDSPSDDVLDLLARIQRGDQAAANKLVDRYARQLTKLLKPLFAGADSQVRNKFEPESVIQSVWRTVFRRHQDGEFEFQHDGAVWKLLALIARRKFSNKCQWFRCQKRNSAMEWTVQGTADETRASWQALASDPTPDEAAALKELLENLLAGLSEKQRQAFELHLENPTDGKKETDEEHHRRIAEAVGVSDSTVRRWLNQIEKKLEKKLGSGGDEGNSSEGAS